MVDSYRYIYHFCYGTPNVTTPLLPLQNGIDLYITLNLKKFCHFIFIILYSLFRSSWRLSFQFFDLKFTINDLRSLCCCHSCESRNLSPGLPALAKSCCALCWTWFSIDSASHARSWNKFRMTHDSLTFLVGVGVSSIAMLLALVTCNWHMSIPIYIKLIFFFLTKTCIIVLYCLRRYYNE